MVGDSGEAWFAYVGCRTTRERNARGDGLSVYRVDRDSGAWTLVQLVGDLVNPSFLALGRDGRHLYAVHGDTSDVSAFARDAVTGRLTPLDKQSTQGRNPVHLALDASGRFLVVANHVTSTLAVLPVRDDGTLGAVVDLVTLTGKVGPHRVEQPFAKPHQVVFDPAHRFMIVPDKGLDCIFTFSLGPVTGKLVPAGPDRVRAREGSGPRHAAFHPSQPYAYVVNELDSTVAAYHFDPGTGRLAPFQVLSALSESFTGDSRASEIEVSRDGRFVHASSRGQDAIAVFAVAPHTGRLTPVNWTPSGGKTPRFFASDPNGRRLYAANEDSDTIVGFDRDVATGELRPSGRGPDGQPRLHPVHLSLRTPGAGGTVGGAMTIPGLQGASRDRARRLRHAIERGTDDEVDRRRSTPQLVAGSPSQCLRTTWACSPVAWVPPATR